MKDLSIVDHYSEMDIDELEMELVDINRAIKYEEYRAGRYYSDVAIYFQNIKKLREEAAYVRKLIKELMNE